MAKISSYTVVGSPLLSDILIGSDSNDSNATKNFSIGGMLGLANDPSILTGFVPYTGATQDFALGAYGVSATFGDFGNLLVQGENAFVFGQYYSSATQQHTATGTGLPIDFPSGIISTGGITISSSNKINFAANGVYMITVTARVEHTGGGGDAQISLWATKLGGLVNLSRQVYTVANTHIQDITYSILVKVSNVDDIVINWSTTNTAAKLIPTIPGGPYPASPSVMVNVYKVGK